MNIRKIIQSSKPEDIFDLSNWKDQYQSWIKAVHPDKNPDPKAREAFEKLIQYKEVLENGFPFEDELCKITLKDRILTFSGPKDKLELSRQNYETILNSVKGIDTFPRYLPEKMYFDGDYLKVVLSRRSVLIQDLTLEEKHCRWVLNRLLEFSSLINVHGGWTHCGINPNSVLITPEDHGIQVVSFYHSVQVYDPMRSAIGLLPFRNWYPPEIFTNKRSNSTVDSEMSKRLCCYLLGDKSGTGANLRGSTTNYIHDFLMEQGSVVQNDYIKYQELLNQEPRTFHILNL